LVACVGTNEEGSGPGATPGCQGQQQSKQVRMSPVERAPQRRSGTSRQINPTPRRVMADISATLSSELTRIIECPYPASLSVRIAPPLLPQHLMQVHVAPGLACSSTWLCTCIHPIVDELTRDSAGLGRTSDSSQHTDYSSLHPRPVTMCSEQAGNNHIQRIAARRPHVARSASSV
jgi:hypothetical protein